MSNLTGNVFAVKAFCKNLIFAKENGKESVINEINIMRKLKHKNILQIEEVFETDNSVYLIMEYIEGGSLG